MIIYPLVFADLTMESGTVVFNCFQHFCVYIMYIYIYTCHFQKAGGYRNMIPDVTTNIGPQGVGATKLKLLRIYTCIYYCFLLFFLLWIRSGNQQPDGL